MIDFWYVVNTVIERNVYSAPINIEKICHTYRAKLLPYSKAIETTDWTWEDLTKEYPDGFVLDNDEDWIIVYNDRRPPNRIRFTLAEELMHRLLLHSGDKDFLFNRQNYSEAKYSRYEDEAKHAAGMILVPPSLYYRFRNRFTHAELARMFQVSEACVYTCAQYYDENEEEIKEKFSKKIIRCEIKKTPPKPKTVDGKSL